MSTVNPCTVIDMLQTCDAKHMPTKLLRIERIRYQRCAIVESEAPKISHRDLFATTGSSCSSPTSVHNNQNAKAQPIRTCH
ncbi:hypothetical protein CGGC5_v007527 [Colletotrichum fructicola Nara gc5]|uniref:Uncharacterized protein n=1 Tax=Colletotrichum fructicola (strain Nara gc5) TaxID=1213859 RepID=A0A7J6J6D5_COLFN|nr:hypothetical protein CGGC5_v007527 [Colletotrichum fructicola Nara gc5]